MKRLCNDSFVSMVSISLLVTLGCITIFSIYSKASQFSGYAVRSNVCHLTRFVEHMK